MKLSNDIKIGISSAASWAWGTSLIVGMQVAQQKGLTAWFIWAIANTLTLYLFGVLTKTGILNEDIFNNKYIKYMALCIQGICLIIQMNIIFEVLTKLGVDPISSYSTASLVGIVFTLWMYKRGLETSILTDCYQWSIAIVAILVILGIGYTTSVPIVTYPTSSVGDIKWCIWSACILLSGPIGDVQHWQRAISAGRSSHAYTYGAILFGIYMLLILAISHLEFTTPMYYVLLLCVLCITSSTIDSIAVALHEVCNKKVGTSIALVLCICWGVFVKIGVLTLWSYAGIYRVAFALLILYLAYRLFYRKYSIL